jgi:glycopeptide antibiotics resistance protein
MSSRERHLNPPPGTWLRSLSARSLFFAYLAFIVYGTSVPFHFDRPPTLEDATLIPFWDAERQRIHSIPDLTQNLLLFLPFGVLGSLAFNRGGSPWSKVLRVSAAGFLLSLAVELLQTMSSVRLTSASDVAANTLGSLLGASGGIAFGRSLAPWIGTGLARSAERRPGLLVAGALLLGAALSALAPLVPTLDVGLLRANVKSFLVNPSGSQPLGNLLDDALLFSALAYVGALEISGLGGQRNPAGRGAGRTCLLAAAVVSALALFLEIAQFPLLYHQVSLTTVAFEVAGALAGATAAYAWEGENLRPAAKPGEIAERRPGVAFAFALLAPVLRGLAPFQTKPWRPGSFEWSSLLPFWTLLNHLTVATFLNVFEAAAAYAPLGYVLRARGRSAGSIFAASLGLAWCLELAQIGIVGRTFDLTEGLLAASGAFGGILFFDWLRSRSAAPAAVAATRSWATGAHRDRGKDPRRRTTG